MFTIIKCRTSLILLIIALSVAYIHGGIPGENSQEAVVLKDKGITCLKAGRYIEALDYFMKGMHKATESGDMETYSSCLGNAGTIYGIIGNLDRCLECQLEVYDIAIEAKDTTLISQMLVNLFGTYIQKGDVKNARRIFDLQNRYPFSDITLARHYFLYNQAMLAKAQGNKEMAAFYLIKTADHAKANKDTARLTSQLIELGGLFADGKDMARAIEYVDSALCLSSKSELTVKQIESLRLKERIMRESGDSTEADKLLKMRGCLEDSVFGQQQINAINNRMFEYERETSGKRIDGLEKKIRIQWQTILYGAVMLFILLVSCTIVIINNKRTKAAQKLLIVHNNELELANRQTRQLLASRYDESRSESISERNSRESGGGLSDENAERIYNSVLKIMEDIQTISSPDFNLNSLAKSIGSNSKYVSLAIKQTSGKAFKEFLNEYKIREACRRLSDTDTYGNMTIEAIYRDLGYSSAGGFIEAFKKINGMTPSRYQKLSRETQRNISDA